MAAHFRAMVLALGVDYGATRRLEGLFVRSELGLRG
jgi:hypothetical protein